MHLLVFFGYIPFFYNINEFILLSFFPSSSHIELSLTKIFSKLLHLQFQSEAAKKAENVMK